MIKKSLLSFLVLFAIHAAVIRVSPTLGMATNQWQDNMVKAQQFLYAEDADTAMVGTSLSARILPDSIPSVRSVAFGGCAVEDGLRLILSKPKAPHCVLIETNLFFRNGNDELVEKMTRGAMPQIKRWIPSLRECNEPICLLSGLMIKTAGINAQAAAMSVDTEQLKVSIKRHIVDDKALSETELTQRMETIKSLIMQLEQKGTKPIFFEMPVNQEIYHLKELEQTRQAVRMAFPNTHYTYLPNDTTTYLTTDGLHLDYEGQLRYSSFFRKAIMERTIM
ncbi:MAG: hypothetical protein IJK87_00850 [Prevotella sp.]|nr:hypothetical protein [Prevotella sp.]